MGYDLLRRGDKLDGYDIRELIGHGGMGQVYRAWDPRLERDVALKVLALTEESILKRFAREADAIGRLQNQNVVEIYDCRIDREPPYFVMEYLRGLDLSHSLKQRGPMSFAEAVATMLGVCCAVSACHRVGIIHRDLKPGNVFLSETAEFGTVVKVLDFGVAKLSKMSGDLTNQGKMVGTPRYLAPEQLRGAEADELSDQYAIGLLLYVATTGMPPFAGKEDADLARAIMTADYPPLRQVRPDVPAALDRLTQKAMSADRRDRYPSVLELSRELLECAIPNDQDIWRDIFAASSDTGTHLPPTPALPKVQAGDTGSVTRVDLPLTPSHLATTEVVDDAHLATTQAIDAVHLLATTQVVDATTEVVDPKQMAKLVRQSAEDDLGRWKSFGVVVPVAPMEDSKVGRPLSADTMVDQGQISAQRQPSHTHAAGVIDLRQRPKAGSQLARVRKPIPLLVLIATVVLVAAAMILFLRGRRTQDDQAQKWIALPKSTELASVVRDGGAIHFDAQQTRAAAVTKPPSGTVNVEGKGDRVEREKPALEVRRLTTQSRGLKTKARRGAVQYTNDGAPILE